MRVEHIATLTLNVADLAESKRPAIVPNKHNVETKMSPQWKELTFTYRWETEEK